MPMMYSPEGDIAKAGDNFNFEQPLQSTVDFLRIPNRATRTVDA